MKSLKYLVILLVLGCTAVLAGAPKWNNVTSGNMDWSSTPSDHGSTTYTRIGPMIYGNDGSSAPTPNVLPAPSNIVKLPNGGKFVILDEHTGIEYDSYDRPIKKCYRYTDERIVCQAP